MLRSSRELAKLSTSRSDHVRSPVIFLPVFSTSSLAVGFDSVDLALFFVSRMLIWNPASIGLLT